MKARIYKPAKSAMQSGKGNTKDWILEFVPQNTRFIDPVMGWSGNYDTKQQLHLKFKTLDEAEHYAKGQALDYTVVLPKTRKLIKQTYADNFTGSANN